MLLYTYYNNCIIFCQNSKHYDLYDVEKIILAQDVSILYSNYIHAKLI